MKKYLLVLAGLYCVLSYALAEHPDYPELKKSDANIIGHVLDKKTKEHLPYITIALKGTTIGTVPARCSARHTSNRRASGSSRVSSRRK